MWLILLFILQIPPERVELKVLDVHLEPVPSRPPILFEQDTIILPEVREDIPTLPAKIRKAPELKKVEIPFNEVLYQSISQNTISTYRERVKNAIKSGASDKEITKLKMEMEKTILMQRLEVSKMEGKEEEVQKIKRALSNLENLMKTVEVER
ncbi:MAG: hypothetical protein QMD82_07315 [bacterium]|nr:hypothetical protein [bacterium]